MLAVRPGQRGAGIGTLLKKVQRDEALKEGIDRIFWTFDPLVARNAALNLVRLGARIDTYVPDMYVEGQGDLHRGLGMDRFVAVWDLKSPSAVAFADGATPSPPRWPPEMQPVNTRVDHLGAIIPFVDDLPNAERVLVEIPADIHAVRDRAPEATRLWRESTRRAFLHYLPQGLHVESFHGDSFGRVCYLLGR
jgi:predicted GNAT superfamily acetyltransferase